MFTGLVVAPILVAGCALLFVHEICEDQNILDGAIGSAPGC